MAVNDGTRRIDATIMAWTTITTTIEMRMKNRADQNQHYFFSHCTIPLEAHIGGGVFFMMEAWYSTGCVVCIPALLEGVGLNSSLCIRKVQQKDGD